MARLPADHYRADGTVKTRREIILDRDGNRCLCCGTAENLTLDHIVPRKDGGSNELDNLQTLCGTCNVSKNRKRTRYELIPALDRFYGGKP